MTVSPNDASSTPTTPHASGFPVIVMKNVQLISGSLHVLKDIDLEVTGQVVVVPSAVGVG